MSKRRPIPNEDDDGEEAKQVYEGVEDEQSHPLSEQQGEDLIENIEQDYLQIKELDRYEDEGVDNEQIQLNPEARMQAERELSKREAQRYMETQFLDQYIDQDEIEERQMRRRRQIIIFQDSEEEMIDEGRYTDPQDCKGKLAQWIREECTVKYIKHAFSKFLMEFKGEATNPIYPRLIRQLCIENKQSLEIDYAHLKRGCPTLALWVGLEPALLLPHLNDNAYALACKFYPSFKEIQGVTYVRIRNLPIIDKIRQLRHFHLGKMVRVKGVVTCRGQLLSHQLKVQYKCIRCGYGKGPFVILATQKIELGPCPSCQGVNSFRLDRMRTVYKNFQKITVQESPSDVLPGRIPRNREMVLLGDLVDSCRPGDQVEITGIYVSKHSTPLNVKYGVPVISTHIQVIFLAKIHEPESSNYTAEDEAMFYKWTKDKDLDKKIYGSIAPSIYGHDLVKKSLTFAMFGGVPQYKPHKIRGDINVLLLGDPGIAKSQFLKSIQKVFHRCIYTTGKGASAVGLTASVRMDRQTGQWRLQAGALVLADNGICLIDQFDKMNEQDRVSIHEAMEQQTISVSKAGIVTTLKARCSVIAAANPVHGRYNSQLSFADNIELSDPILSRFDILNVIKDNFDSELDYDLSSFVINSHVQNHPYKGKYFLPEEKLEQREVPLPYIEIQKLRNFIRYAREKCKPVIPAHHNEAIKQFYSTLRALSMQTKGMSVTVRHLQAVIRITQAHAKIYLRGQVNREDVAVGIKTMLESFMQTQKHSVAKNCRKKLAQYL